MAEDKVHFFVLKLSIFLKAIHVQYTCYKSFFLGEKNKADLHLSSEAQPRLGD